MTSRDEQSTTRTQYRIRLLNADRVWCGWSTWTDGPVPMSDGDPREIQTRQVPNYLTTEEALRKIRGNAHEGG